MNALCASTSEWRALANQLQLQMHVMRSPTTLSMASAPRPDLNMYMPLCTLHVYTRLQCAVLSGEARM